MIITEFISRIYGKEGYEIIIKTDSHDHYRATEDFARRLIDHAKHATNADKIRAMNDEELAEMLWKTGRNYRAVCVDPVVDHKEQYEELVKWLQQPAEDGER